ncbi:hypothetical protein JHL17_36695 [Azospirillum sp. YIM B02556]|uniref:Transposase n=1 Tax=Azospirillum endophyticum TaxID=2800326 RepID=A0ABS1FHP0_9PROT|nr:hypothetical protein [Azospirillum endophyticum]MBK1842944.1 hypothetical protein [Azospirillum endophyticum]
MHVQGVHRPKAVPLTQVSPVKTATKLDVVGDFFVQLVSRTQEREEDAAERRNFSQAGADPWRLLPLADAGKCSIYVRRYAGGEACIREL